MEDNDQTEPIGALVETNGYAIWTAVGTYEMSKLRAEIKQMNEYRASIGMPPISEVNDTTPVDGKPGLVRALAEGTIPEGATVWAIDLSAPGAMQLAFAAGLPGVDEVEGRYVVVPQIGDELVIGEHTDRTPVTIKFTVGQAGRGKTFLPELAKVLGRLDLDSFGSEAVADCAGRWERYAQAAPEVSGKLAAARAALAALLDDDPDGDAMRNGELFGPEVTEALARLINDAQLGPAAQALRFALHRIRVGDLPGALRWCDLVHEALALDAPGADTLLTGIAGTPPVTSNTDVRLVWVDSDDEPHTGTADQLGHYLDVAGLSGGPDVTAVYAARGGELARCEWTTSSTPAGDDYADAKVTVTLPDGSQVEGSWRVDGRA